VFSKNTSTFSKKGEFYSRVPRFFKRYSNWERVYDDFAIPNKISARLNDLSRV
jgi:hypothetical protein